MSGIWSASIGRRFDASYFLGAACWHSLLLSANWYDSAAMAVKRDYYDVLGVSRDADDADIKRAFRKLAQRHHPDVDKGDGAEERFKELNEAYRVLSDRQRRSAYDMFGHEIGRAHV